MSKVAVEIDLKELERVVERLPMPVKIRLAKRWGSSTDDREWDRLFASIDRRRKGRRVTTAEVVREVKAYRRERAGG